MDSIENNVVVGTASADKVVLKLQGSSLKLPKNKPFSFTANGNKTLFELPIVGFATKKDLGSTRRATEDDILSLVENAKGFQKSYLLAYLANFTQHELSQIMLTFTFLPHITEIKKANHLDTMLFCLYNSVAESATGKFDYAVLEKDFLKLIKDKPISDYIPRARNHSYQKVLSHNKKIVKKVKQAENAKTGKLDE